MGLLINKQEQRSELQERIAAELREKSARTNLPENKDLDNVEDLAYMKGTTQATSNGWMWIIMIIVGAGIFISFLAQGL